jgi:DNA-binding protein HU-alpha
MTKKPTKSRATKTTTPKKKVGKSKPVVSDKPVSPKPIHVPPVEPSVVKTATPVVSTPAVKKKDLVDDVVRRSGLKKKDVKPVVEATLAALGDALAQDKDLNLPPFAKLKIQRVKELSGARVTVARLRQKRDDPDKTN